MAVRAAATTAVRVGAHGGAAIRPEGTIALKDGTFELTSFGGQFRGPAYVSDNLSLSKTFPIREAANLEARFDAFNMTNTPAFGLPNGSLGSNLGKITGTLGSGVGNVNGVGGPRVLQASVKFTF